MILSDSSQIKLAPVTEGASLSGIDSAKVTEGVAVFDNIGFIYKPGAQGVIFKATNSEIDQNKVSKLNLCTDNTIEVNFRWCQPGEMIDSDTICRICSTGSYSLEWNSTQCDTCMDNAVCLGGSEIEVYPEYWRGSLNSTTIEPCPRPSSWKGGYNPENKHPVKWETGYSSYLCMDWEIVDGSKYQRVASFQCNKWPNLIANSIRVIGVMLVAFAFVMVLIITMIRKKKENQTSILLKIMTNYIQLLSTAMAFGLQFPPSLISLLGPVNILGSTSDTFLSFDCFIEDTDMKGFAPSTEIFKVFLAFFCPLVLMAICTLIWITLYMINRQRFMNIKRHVIISVICIVFMMHPAISKLTLSLFECIEVENTRRMRLHMDYECYSADHILWLVSLGLPCIAVWVVGAPILAFIIVYKHRDRLEDGSVKKYLLILYQGLTKKAYYWEFLNTIRKTLILSFYAILSFVSITYRVFLCLFLLIGMLRIQQRLKPYKKSINNELEMKAIAAGTLTLY